MLTCTTLGSTCDATRATGSSAGICVDACTGIWATFFSPGPDSSSEHPTSKTTASAAMVNSEFAPNLGLNVLDTSCRRPQGRFVHHRVYTKVAQDGFRVTFYLHGRLVKQERG